MVAQITVDQAAKPPGVAGRAREDLDTGTSVVLTSSGGPFSAHLWELVDAPIDVLSPATSAATLATPLAATTNVSPIDLEGTYKARLTVDSGSGLGANAADIAEITFAAQLPANPLAVDPAELPRRRPAFTERTEHNVADALFPTGNPRGYATEWDRWFAAIDRMALGKSFGWAEVTVAVGGPATIVVPTGAFNTSVTWIALGQIIVTFTRPLANTDYAVTFGMVTNPGSAIAANKNTTDFTVFRFNPAGLLADDSFSFDVKHRAV
jgi:hypothetical protein